MLSFISVLLLREKQNLCLPVQLRETQFSLFIAHLLGPASRNSWWLFYEHKYHIPCMSAETNESLVGCSTWIIQGTETSLEKSSPSPPNYYFKKFSVKHVALLKNDEICKFGAAGRRTAARAGSSLMVSIRLGDITERLCQSLGTDDQSCDSDEKVESFPVAAKGRFQLFPVVLIFCCATVSAVPLNKVMKRYRDCGCVWPGWPLRVTRSDHSPICGWTVLCGPQQERSCWLCTTSPRPRTHTWSTTLSRSRCRSRTAPTGSKAWRQTGWITWPNTSTTGPRSWTDTFTWATSMVRSKVKNMAVTQ